MAIYWRVKSIPELEGMPRDVQKDLWRVAKGKMWDNGTWLRTFLFLLMPWAAIAFVVSVWLISGYWNDNKLMQVLAPHLLMWPVYFVYKPLMVHHARAEIREYIASGN